MGFLGKVCIGVVMAMALTVGVVGTAGAGRINRATTSSKLIPPATQTYCLYGAVSFSTPLDPTTGTPTKDSISWQLTNCVNEGQVAQGSLGGVLSSRSQSCAGGVASGSVLLGWQSGGDSKARLHFSISPAGGDDIPVTVSGKIVSGQFAGDTISDQGTIDLQTSTGSACATVANNGQPLLGGNVDPDGDPTYLHFTG